MAMTTEAIAQLADAIRQQTLSQAEKIPPQPPVAAVAFKAPPFWTTNASAWFLRLEATFATHTPPITNDDKISSCGPTSRLRYIQACTSGS